MTPPVPPWPVRRLLIAPLMPVLFVVALALLPVVVVGQAVCAAVAFATTPLRTAARPVRARAPRLWAFLVVYLGVETACLLACLVLWLLAGFGRHIGSQRQQRWHLGLLRRLLAALIATARFVFRFRLEVDEPALPLMQRRVGGATGRDPDRMATPTPILVLARHAGPGASFVLVHLLLSRYGREVRVVMKEQLRLDPSLDILLTRLGCAFIATGRKRRDDPVEVITRTAEALDPRQALLLYPEGGDWTPTRQRLAVARLRRRGLAEAAELAARMPHVLPPRPAGTLAALRAAPHADVVVFNHTGQDDLIDAVSVWRALPLRRQLRLIWWREPADAIPDDDEERAEWLLELWQRIDAWIAEQNALAAVTTPNGPGDG